MKQKRHTQLGDIWESFLEEALFELHFDREARVPGTPGLHVEEYAHRTEKFTTA